MPRSFWTLHAILEYVHAMWYSMHARVLSYPQPVASTYSDPIGLMISMRALCVASTGLDIFAHTPSRLFPAYQSCQTVGPMPASSLGAPQRDSTQACLSF